MEKAYTDTQYAIPTHFAQIGNQFGFKCFCPFSALTQGFIVPNPDGASIKIEQLDCLVVHLEHSVRWTQLHTTYVALLRICAPGILAEEREEWALDRDSQEYQGTG